MKPLGATHPHIKARNNICRHCLQGASMSISKLAVVLTLSSFAAVSSAQEPNRVHMQFVAHEDDDFLS
jgi:hypothetical protein